MQLLVGHLADIGPEREYQEDAYAFHLVAPEATVASRRGAILVIADGAAGQPGSGPASRLAANTICERYYASPSDYAVEALRQAMIAANSVVWEAGNGRGRGGMVTRVLCAVVQGEQFLLGCVGGSGAYLVHAGQTTSLTYDDDTDGATEEGPALGLAPQVEPEVEVMGTLSPGDRLLLCTDGLHRRVGTERIGAVVQALPPQEACEELRDLAREEGSSDGLVALVVEVQGTAEREEGGEETVFAMPEPEAAGPPALREMEERPHLAEVELAARDRALQQARAELPARDQDLQQPRAEGLARDQAQAELERMRAVLEERDQLQAELERMRAEFEGRAQAQAELERIRAEMQVRERAQAELEERELALLARKRELQARDEALSAGEAAQAERDRRLLKLEGVLQAREQDLATRERQLAEVRQAEVDVGAARGETSAVRQAQAELRGVLSALQQGYEGLEGTLRQVAVQTTSLGRDQEALLHELGGQARELGLWQTKLDEYEQGLRAWQERLAEAEARAQQAALMPRPGAPPGATALHQWTCEVAFSSALAAGGVQQEERIELPDGSTVVCGLTVQREFVRRQYPMAIEVWASSDEGTVGRLVVGYGLDVRTMPPGVVQERGLVVLTQGDEVIALPLGPLTVYAAVTGCEFASVAQHKVSRDYSAFLSLAVTFRVVTRA